MNEMVNLKSETNGNDIIISPKDKQSDSYLFLNYLKDKVNLLDEKDRSEFVKSTELIIRNSLDYKAYIAHLKETNPDARHCALFNNMTDDNCIIEMHHGPILSLAEIVVIVLNHYIKNNIEITSFKIADEILEDHWDNLIEVVFLSKFAHKLTSNKKTTKDSFISVESCAAGDLVSFIERYNDSVTYYEINKIKNYLYFADQYAKDKDKSIYHYLHERVKSFKYARPKDEDGG